MTDATAGTWGEAAREAVRDLVGAGEGMATLRELVAVRDLAEQALADNVHAARREGASWADVAAVLGTSRQAAWERYS